MRRFDNTEAGMVSKAIAIAETARKNLTKGTLIFILGILSTLGIIAGATAFFIIHHDFPTDYGAMWAGAAKWLVFQGSSWIHHTAAGFTYFMAFLFVAGLCTDLWASSRINGITPKSFTPFVNLVVHFIAGANMLLLYLWTGMDMIYWPIIVFAVWGLDVIACIVELSISILGYE